MSGDHATAAKTDQKPRGHHPLWLVPIGILLILVASCIFKPTPPQPVIYLQPTHTQAAPGEGLADGFDGRRALRAMRPEPGIVTRTIPIDMPGNPTGDPDGAWTEKAYLPPTDMSDLDWQSLPYWILCYTTSGERITFRGTYPADTKFVRYARRAKDGGTIDVAQAIPQ
jgi:hypothetical protein